MATEVAEPVANGQGSQAEVRRVLIASSHGLRPELVRPSLSRGDVRRVDVPDLESAYAAARALRPSLVIVDGDEHAAAARLVRLLRQDADTREGAIVVLAGAPTLDEEQALRQAGANVVFPGRVDPDLWDSRLEELLNVPRRRAARIPVLLEAWSRQPAAAEPQPGVALNISVNGVLLETGTALAAGSKLDLSFRLPDEAEDLQVVGQVVRDAGAHDGRQRHGVKFVVLRGQARDRIREFVEDIPRRLVDPFGPAATDAAREVEREEWEAQLRASEAWKTAILDSALDGILTLDQDGRVLEGNRAAEAIFGYGRGQAVGLKVDALVPALRDRLGRGLAHDLATAGGTLVGRRMETTGRRPDGTEFPLELAVTPLALGTRHVFIAYLRDITERRRAEEGVRASARQFRSLFEAAMDAMVVTDDEGRYVEANAAACALHGVARAQLLGHRLGDHARAGFDFDSVWAALRRDGRARGEMAVLRPDGQAREIEFSVTADFLPGSHLVVLRDVTEGRQLEAQFRQAQKMEPLGRLAGGVAHDFNNLLNVITGYGELIARGLAAGSPARQRTEHILRAAERAAALTRQLLAFSRRQVLQSRVLDLNAVVSDTARLLGRLIGADITLALRLDSRLGRLKADPSQIDQVLMNLAVNARDAMPRGGTITFETRNADLDEEYAREHLGARPGPYVLLEVTDTGVGMDAETQRHIFEPFFTTKPKGKGTGLGLATVYGVVKQSGGYVWVESRPGRGTRFQVFLPRVDEPLDLEAPASAPEPAPRGGETVLLVEDEDLLRRMIREVLETSDYRVLEAANADEAVRLSRSHPGTIDVMVTDVIMPGRSGPELASALSGARPRMKVLYVSGYTDDAFIPAVSPAEGTDFLQKPFTPAALESRLRALLDAPSL
ncbi:MAG TPA: PAS domain S-box protein [Vicinamibacteria bacterium]|nr:PAS domain S-box protein [Vicinamibacteria bacterium]